MSRELFESIAALPATRRSEAFGEIAQTLEIGPCSLVRFGPGKQPIPDMIYGVYVVAAHVLRDLPEAKHIANGNVTIEILSTYPNA